MIQILRDNTSVSILVETNLPHDCNGEHTTTFHFKYDTGKPFFAALLADHIRTVLWSAIRKAKADAYEQGWKDAKAHRTKQDWFSSVL